MRTTIHWPENIIQMMKPLGIQHPIMQAPMAGGPSTPQLAAAISNRGGLGSLAAGYLTLPALKEQIIETRKLTRNPFLVNLFVPTQLRKKASSDIELSGTEMIRQEEQLKRYWEKMAAYHKTLGIPLPNPETIKTNITFEKQQQDFEEKINLLIEEKVGICSFTFGIPRPTIIAKLRKANIFIIGTATSPAEAIELEHCGFDGIVAQGYEAGGHRGSFLDTDENMSTLSLITQTKDRIRKDMPLFAAGGIMDERGVAAVINLGAMASMGTAFIPTSESGAAKAHKDAILGLEQNNQGTMVTETFTGKPARGIRNEFMQEMKEFESLTSAMYPFPELHYITQSLRAAAVKQNRPNFCSFWAGQNGRLAVKYQPKSGEKSATEFFSQLIKKTLDILSPSSPPTARL